MQLGRYIFCLALCSLALKAPAEAQRAPAGLFGATRSTSDGLDLLTLQMAISEAFDSSVAPDARLPSGSLNLGGRSSILTGDVDYAAAGHGIRVFAGAAGSFRYSYQAEQGRPGPASGRTGLRLPMSRAGVLSLSQAVAYSPSYLYELLPGGALAETDVPLPPSNPVYRIDATESLRYRTQLGLTTGRGLGWGLSTTASYTRADSLGDVDALRGDRELYEVGTRATFHPSRRRGMFVGSRYRRGRFGNIDGTTTGYEVPLGFEFTPALTPTRRIAIRVEVTPTLVDTFVPAESDGEGGAGSERRRRFPVQGAVGLDYPFLVKWRLSTGYLRSVDYMSVLSEPVVTDGGRMQVSGVVSRRVDVALEARYAVATSVASSGRGRLRTASGDARVRFALTRSIAVFGEYVYYSNDVGGRRQLEPDLPAEYDQHSVRLGVTLATQPFNR